MSKLVIISAPSGSGKTTIVNNIINNPEYKLSFSVSATSRSPRDYEINGEHYYFLSVDTFKEKIKNNEFVEWQEVYPNQFYGTLKNEITRVFSQNKNIIFDVDVLGALNIKKEFPDNSVTIFIQPPSVEELRKRLENRGSETPESMQKRIDKAIFELSFSPKFDFVVINDILEDAVNNTAKILNNFLLGK